MIKPTVIPAILGSLLLVNIAAVQNLLKRKHPAAMVGVILGSIGLILLIFKYVPAESF
jgi:hypothetical protein